MAAANQNQQHVNDSELRNALLSCKSSFMSAGFFSLFINLLLLMPAIYMLQVYDRVLSSGSESTLLMLTLIMVFLFLIMGGLEWTRSQILIGTSNRLQSPGSITQRQSFRCHVRSGPQQWWPRCKCPAVKRPASAASVYDRPGVVCLL